MSCWPGTGDTGGPFGISPGVASTTNLLRRSPGIQFENKLNEWHQEDACAKSLCAPSWCSPRNSRVSTSTTSRCSPHRCSSTCSHVRRTSEFAASILTLNCEDFWNERRIYHCSTV